MQPAPAFAPEVGSLTVLPVLAEVICHLGVRAGPVGSDFFAVLVKERVGRACVPVESDSEHALGGAVVRS